MDPLSLISGVAGVATAGTALVSSLYTLVETVRNAPRQMKDVAKEMTSLTCVLEYLVEIISDGHQIATRQYLHGIRSMVKSIGNTQNEIMDMIDDRSIISRLRWRKSKTLLQDIRAHQSMVSMQVAILNLGMLKKSIGHKEKSSERRLRKQAESLVQASSACLEEDNDLRFAPPPPRSAPPPFDSTAPYGVHHYGEPDLQRRNGHIKEDSYSPGDGSIPPVPPLRPSAAVPEGGNEPYKKPPIILGYPSSLPALPQKTQPGRSGPADAEAARKHTLMTYTRKSHSDAATLLYNLVFSSPEEDSGYESGRADQASSGNDTEDDRYSVSIEDCHSSDDDDDVDLGNTIRRPFARMGRNSDSYNRPSMVVNNLLLKWTSLTSQEVEENTTGTEDYAENDRLRSIRGTVAAIAAENRKQESNARPTARPATPDSSSEWDPDSSDHTPQASHAPPRNHFARPSADKNTPNYTVPPYAPYGYGDYFNSWNYKPAPPPTAVPNGSAVPPPPAHGTTGYNFYPNHDPFINPFTPAAGKGWEGNPQYPNNSTFNPTDTKGLYSFKQPNILILNKKYEIDEGKDFGDDKLDVLNKGFQVERQRPGDTIYNPVSFLSRYGLQGEGILGAIAASKSNATCSELWRTLEDGFYFQIPYSRSSDLGETWFLGERPVFVSFYHSSYQPQFFPTSEDDKTAFDRDCVTIGEQWITEEALKQHGIVPRGRENGKLILEPSVSTSELMGLVDLSQALLWIEQRRRYAKTFYKPLEMFRAVHDPAPPPVTTPSSPVTTPLTNNLDEVAGTKRRPEVDISNQSQSSRNSQTPDIKSEEPGKVKEAKPPAQAQTEVQPPTDKPDRLSSEPVTLVIPQKTNRERRRSHRSSRYLNPDDIRSSRSEHDRSERGSHEQQRPGSGRERSGSDRTERERSDRNRSHRDRRSPHRSSYSYTASEDRLDKDGHRRRRSDVRTPLEDEHPSSGSGGGGMFSFLRRKS